jgi:hypothetical protein
MRHRRRPLTTHVHCYARFTLRDAGPQAGTNESARERPPHQSRRDLQVLGPKGNRTLVCAERPPRLLRQQRCLTQELHDCAGGQAVVAQPVHMLGGGGGETMAKRWPKAAITAGLHTSSADSPPAHWRRSQRTRHASASRAVLAPPLAVAADEAASASCSSRSAALPYCCSCAYVSASACEQEIRVLLLLGMPGIQCSQVFMPRPCSM